MKLNEIAEQPDAHKAKIGQFVQDWALGKYHLQTEGVAIPNGIFQLIQEIYPNSLYSGKIYRGIELEQQQVQQLKQPQQLRKLITGYKHPNQSKMYSWSTSPEDVNDWLLMSGAMPDEDDTGKTSEPYSLWVFISERTSKGISLDTLSQALIEDGVLEHKTQASQVGEVIAPMERSMLIEEFVLVFDVIVENGELATAREPINTWEKLQEILKMIANGPVSIKAFVDPDGEESRFMSY